MSLSRKMLRDIKINKTQFIAIFLMAFIGIFAYSGIYAEYYGLEQTSNDFYSQPTLPTVGFTIRILMIPHWIR